MVLWNIMKELGLAVMSMLAPKGSQDTPEKYERDLPIYRGLIDRHTIRNVQWELFLISGKKTKRYCLDVDILQVFNLIQEYPEITTKLKNRICEVYLNGHFNTGSHQNYKGAQWMNEPTWDNSFCWN